ncbi:MAG: 23S rRNA (uracil-C(5))-methyltransferase RlmCD [Chlamydiia bacterium]|nr:23S rRNA (uracil-C(5))-methyltransferase RlmCD [Chlamydiia bacterium]
MKKVKTEIRDLSSTGEGIGSCEEGVLFVDDALVEEEVLCKVILKKKNYSKGELLEIIKPSVHRIKPPCPYFSKCGGCQLQHADAALQKRIKRSRVERALKKIAKVSEDKIEDFISSPKAFGYRNKIALPLVFEGGKKKVGFYKKRSHEIVSIDTCMLHDPFADEIYQKIKTLLLESTVTFYSEKQRSGNLQHFVMRSSDFEKKVLIGLIGLNHISKEIKKLCEQIYKIPGVKGVVYGKKAKATNSIYPEVETVVCGEGTLTQKILGLKIKISLLSFFQVNRECASLMYQRAFELASLKKGQRVLDAYCGIGSFAIYLAQQNIKVTGIESFSSSVLDAKMNAEANEVSIDFIEGEVEKKLSGLDSFDCIFINPPRKGVHVDVIEAIDKKNISKIVYTSCDPATLSRDIQLLAIKGYELKKILLFDMFPQTLHVESVALLEKKCC